MMTADTILMDMKTVGMQPAGKVAAVAGMLIAGTLAAGTVAGMWMMDTDSLAGSTLGQMTGQKTPVYRTCSSLETTSFARTAPARTNAPCSSLRCLVRTSPEEAVIETLVVPTTAQLCA